MSLNSSEDDIPGLESVSGSEVKLALWNLMAIHVHSLNINSYLFVTV